MMRFAAIAAACLTLGAPALASTGDHAVAPGKRLDGLLTSAEPGTTGSVQAAPAGPAKPPCPPERRVGTGAGFCLIN